MELRVLLASQFNLPSIPRVVALLLSELDKDEPDLMKVSQLISTDPALTRALNPAHRRIAPFCVKCTAWQQIFGECRQ